MRTEGPSGSVGVGRSGLTADVFERHADRTCEGLAVGSGFVRPGFSKLSSVVNGCSWLGPPVSRALFFCSKLKGYTCKT